MGCVPLLRFGACSFVIAKFPPDDPFLPVLVFGVLLIALLVQVAQRPMIGYLDNLLEEFTLVLLLVCFTLAQVVMADKNPSRSEKSEITLFLNLAKYLDALVVLMFGLCIGLRMLLKRSQRVQDFLNGDWGRRLTRVLTIEEQEARMSMPGSVRRITPLQSRSSAPEEPLFSSVDAAAAVATAQSRPASPGLLNGAE
jgi:hypothetical protein